MLQKSTEDASFFKGLLSHLKKRFDDPSFADELQKLQGMKELAHLKYGTPEWNVGMFQQLEKMRNEGDNIGNLFVTRQMDGHSNVICKLEPYNQCYSIGADGTLALMPRKQRPVARLLRVY